MRRTGLIVYVHVGEGRLDVEPGGDRGRRFHLDPSAPDAGTVDVGEAFDIEIDEVFEPALEERGPKLAGTDALLHADGESSAARSEEHTSELQSLMRISYAVFCLKKKKQKTKQSK